MSIPAEITTEPVTISPYTIGCAVPARLVFVSPLNANEILGSSSCSSGVGSGNNNSETPF